MTWKVLRKKVFARERKVFVKSWSKFWNFLVEKLKISNSWMMCRISHLNFCSNFAQIWGRFLQNSNRVSGIAMTKFEQIRTMGVILIQSLSSKIQIALFFLEFYGGAGVFVGLFIVRHRCWGPHFSCSRCKKMWFFIWPISNFGDHFFGIFFRIDVRKIFRPAFFRFIFLDTTFPVLLLFMFPLAEIEFPWGRFRFPLAGIKSHWGGFMFEIYRASDSA